MSFLCPSTSCGRMFDSEPVMAQHFRRRHPTEKIPSKEQPSKSNGIPKKGEGETTLPRIGLKRASSRDNSARDDNVKLPVKMEVKDVITMSRATIHSDQANRSKLNTLSNTQIKTKGSLQAMSSTLTPVQQKDPQIKTSATQDFKTNQVKNNPPAMLKRRLSLKKQKDNDTVKKELVQPKQPALTVTSTTTNTPSTQPKPKLVVRPRSRQKKTNEIPKQKSVIVDFTRGPTTCKLDVQRLENKLQEEDSQGRDTKTVIVKVPTRQFKPTFLNIEVLYLNNIGLETISLDGLQFLYELSAQGNRLTNMDFLDYQENGNIETVNLSSNLISSLFIPPNVENLSIALNQIKDLQCTAQSLKGSKLRTLDLSGNPVVNETTFRYQVILNASLLTKLNGHKISSFDVNETVQYKTLLDRKPQSKTATASHYARFNPQLRMNMSTTTGFYSTNTFKEEDNTRLQKQIKDLNVKAKEIRNGLDIICEENRVLRKEIGAIDVQQVGDQDLDRVCQHLQVEMEALQLMNFLRHSEKEQLEEMVKDMKHKLLGQVA